MSVYTRNLSFGLRIFSIKIIHGTEKYFDMTYNSDNQLLAHYNITKIEIE
jgi:hypothetical protein